MLVQQLKAGVSRQKTCFKYAVYNRKLLQDLELSWVNAPLLNKFSSTTYVCIKSFKRCIYLFYLNQSG